MFRETPVDRILRGAAIVAAALLLSSYSLERSFSPETLARFDPTRLADAFCGDSRARSTLLSNLLIASAVAAPAGAPAQSMPLYPDLARGAFALTTSNKTARSFFHQGLLLNYGFNHAGAVRSFREAQRLDPGCATCWWGEAVALGPNINAPMDERDRGAALDAMDRAMQLRNRASAAEQALIQALTRRYSRDPAADRAALDAAYADAMLAVAAQFPDDDDIAVLAAEAVMDTSPWNYWEADKRTPIGRSGEAVRLVDKVLARHPGNTQANHLYIHLMENSDDPRRAESAADRLAAAHAPSAGHLVHMPAHIYQLVGRHPDSIRANVAAARADEVFIRSTHDEGLVRYGYHPHNVHFIVTSAQMAGDMQTAIREAMRLRTLLAPEVSARIAWIQAIDAAPFFAMAQFATPEAILAMPAPDARLPYALAMRHYARAVAYAQLRDQPGFEREMGALAAMRTSNAFAEMIAQGVPAPELLSLAEATARGRLAYALGNNDEAAQHYRDAIALERRIPYQEPPYWYYPVQQSLGAALFRAGRLAEASQSFRTALLQTPHNGWALFGLAQSEKALGHDLEAAAARQALQRDWLGDEAWLKMDRL
jgi:tetratricopeptide (TPR) repeat protein